MATLNRRPLANRPLPLQVPSIFSPLKSSRTVSGSSKRARSPDPIDASTSKRARAVAPAPSTLTAARDVAKERKQAEREQQKAEFKDKYCRAFPHFRFYFDLENIEPDRAATQDLEARIQQLGGYIEDFFSSEITHLITNQSVPPTSSGDTSADKENHLKSKTSLFKPANLLKSPIKLRARGDDNTAGFDLVTKAAGFNIKIWNTTKLDSVLLRCIDPPSASVVSTTRAAATPTQPSTTANSQRSLSRLLHSERIHGTSERDPTQKRHDFRYFSRSSRFVLVEDMWQELATIASHEYPAKGREGKEGSKWPVLHCHPQARGPFIPFDEREKRRWEKMQQADAEQENEREKQRNKIMRAEEMKRRTEAQLHAKRAGDLRRSVSMSNLHRRASHPVAGPPDGYLVDLDAEGDNQDSANASGYLASGPGGGYMAASGNSVGITSTTGTTSNTSYSLRNVQLPSALSGRMKQEIITSRKPPTAADKPQAGKGVGTMGPPLAIPEKQPMLRKSRSTNTMKLPKREEGSKPGYCESCRTKFEDFKTHIAGRKHKKFAADDANFLQLDCVLARVQRRTLREVEEEQKKREARRHQHCYRILQDSNNGAVEPGDDNCAKVPLRSSSPGYDNALDLKHRQRNWEHEDDDTVMTDPDVLSLSAWPPAGADADADADAD